MALVGGDDNVCDHAHLLGVSDLQPWTCVPAPLDPRIKAIVPFDGSNQCLIDEATFEQWVEWDCTSLPQPVAHKLTSKYAIAFLKTHLSGESGYQSILTPGWALTRETFIEFFETERKNANSIGDDWPDLFVYFPHQSGSQKARAQKDSTTPMPVWYAGRR